MDGPQFSTDKTKVGIYAFQADLYQT